MTNFWREPWDERGPILQRRANTPAMRVHLGGVDSECPKGNPIRCNDWRFDLRSIGGPP